MLILLPPSESKRTGGTAGQKLDLSRLGFPELSAARKKVLSALRVTSRSVSGSYAALKLGPKQRFEVDRNRALLTSPTMPALDRYSGVLYDGLAASTLPTGSRRFAHDHLVVHSALFGLLRALDAVPAYRLSHDSRLPGLNLKQTWGAAISAVLNQHDGLIIDLRSDGYRALGPIPPRRNAVVVDVVAARADGTTKALNHFNKKGKGEFARALLLAAEELPDTDALLGFSQDHGIRLRAVDSFRVQLVVDEDT